MREFWEKNRQFLTQVLTGAGLFLLLCYFVFGVGNESRAMRSERTRLLQEVRRLQKQYTSKEGLSSGGVKSLARELEDRRTESCVGVPDDLSETTSLRTRFLKAKTRVCSNLDRLAVEEAVDIKENLTAVNFHEQSTDGIEEYRNHWATLETFRRLLSAVVSSGFSEVRSVVCEIPQTVSLGSESDRQLRRYGVKVEVTGQYKHFVRLYDKVTQPGKFLYLVVDQIKPKPGADSSKLYGSVKGYGLRIVKKPERKSSPEEESWPGRFKR